MSKTNVLRAMVVGFTLVILLVLSAGYLGYQGSQAIQHNAQDLVREHLVNSERGAALEKKIEQQSEELLNQLALVLGLCLLLAVGCAVLTIRATIRSFQRMQWQTEELNRVSWHMLRDREEVARQFSHEMHDELGQLLTGLRGMMKRMNPAEFESRRGECVEALEEALTSVRELSQLLRPVILDDFGLQAGLRWLSERFTQRTQIPVEFTTNDESRMSDELETHLFRIAQEALTNIARHSHAGQAWIKLMVQDGIVSLTIEDDGRGLAADKLHRSSSLGMVGMRARARQVSGDLLVQNRESGGLRVQVQAPLRRMHDAGSPEDSSVVSR